jgi:DNA-binding protein Fis
MPKVVVGSTQRRLPEESSNFSETEIDIVRKLVGHSIAEVERELIRETLVAHRGNRTRSADILSVSVRTLRNRIRAYKACGLAICEASPTCASVEVCLCRALSRSLPDEPGGH